MQAETSKEWREENDLFTYRRIRKAIGFLGISLPIVLVGFSFIPFFKTELQPSISHYYFTNLREIFTGTLWAVGLFLIRYKGHINRSILKNDSLLTNLAGVMAFGAAIVPTTPEAEIDKDQLYTLIPYPGDWLGWVHYGFATALFLIFSILAINVFTIGQAKNIDIPVSAVNENKIYRICGCLIIVFIAMIPIADQFNLFRYSTLVFEALALFAFGVAWLIKGRALGDTGKIGEMVYREHNIKAGDPRHYYTADA
ncbi:hypothetical protein D770_16305 [Flammeovirgaceae bacterium 311]|nr:hypothetical protein D770_16305 [Flammeovirgaceae bacterium 311]